jgi:hypothetical protein
MGNTITSRLGFWLTTSLFSLFMSFTAYNELASPQVAAVFTHLGFPSYAFRLELSIAKILGVLALLLPVPAQVKEWAYAGFAINLVSALIAHLAVGDEAAMYVWSIGFLVFLTLSYVFRSNLEKTR